MQSTMWLDTVRCAGPKRNVIVDFSFRSRFSNTLFGLTCACSSVHKDRHIIYTVKINNLQQTKFISKLLTMLLDKYQAIMLMCFSLPFLTPPLLTSSFSLNFLFFLGSLPVSEFHPFCRFRIYMCPNYSISIAFEWLTAFTDIDVLRVVYTEIAINLSLQPVFSQLKIQKVNKITKLPSVMAPLAVNR